MFQNCATHTLKLVLAASLLAGHSAPGTTPPAAVEQRPAWLPSAVIYCVYPEIFSSHGFAGVTAQLERLHRLGVTVLWLMPVTPFGQPYQGHPAFGSPYGVRDYYAVNPQYGAAADLKQFVAAAHRLGIKVILDEVLNHTSWDNPLTTEHPEYYRHSDGNTGNPRSEVQAFNFADVAQLDYRNQGSGLWAYMDRMLTYWVTEYGVDGFRFDTADDPRGSHREIPKAFWLQLDASLQAVKPGLLMLGEEEDPDLALAPFPLDYGWDLEKALKAAASGASSVDALQSTWQAQQTGWPAGMLHMSLLQDWDLGEDLQIYGGAAQTMDAAVFNFTLDGVPLLFNGEEVGNDASSLNTHHLIHWDSPHADAFSSFYEGLMLLRKTHAVLQQGQLRWLPNSVSSRVATYLRSGDAQDVLVEINFSDSAAQGTVTVPAPGTWKEITPASSLGSGAHAAPGVLSLQPHGFAIFERDR